MIKNCLIVILAVAVCFLVYDGISGKVKKGAAASEKYVLLIKTTVKCQKQIKGSGLDMQSTKVENMGKDVDGYLEYIGCEADGLKDWKIKIFKLFKDSSKRKK